jgi:undecaprenyl-diphosphatase
MADYIFLGILQGVFEWIPVSSEGVVVLASHFLIKEINPIDIALFLHLGTLLAVLIYFRKDWLEVLSFKNLPLLRFLIIATLISLVIGYPFYKIISRMTTGAILLFIVGLGLLLTAQAHKFKKSFSLGSSKNLNKLAVLTGFLQGLAVIPGLSRSGATIFGLSLGKLSPRQILKISYMMSAPIVLASSIYLFWKNPLLVAGWPSLISSFLVGLASLSLLMKLAERINFYRFALIFALLCFAGGLIGLII